ncbi:MAG TPA: family 16 glycosylhydrolase [Lacipirellulaceae bacterium]|nr:family 16 glycosylhydrolase [Lacipirellulaceae bacterium]
MVAFVLAVAYGPLTAVAQIPDVPGWQLFWHDEFDGNTLNTTNWTALSRQNQNNNEKEYYTPGQVSVANGNLQLTATNQPMGNKAYRSGLITSNMLFGQGRIEARIDLPTTQGMWPAFWMNPNQVQWPLGGDIDIMENKGSEPTVVSDAFHWQKDPGPCCDAHQYTTRRYGYSVDGQPVNFTTGFHTYAAEWDKSPTTNANEIRFYVDDTLVNVVDENSSMSDANFTTAKNIILNLAVGGDFGGDPNGTTVFPQTMLVDYVRVWHRQTGLAGDYNGDGVVDSADYVVWRQMQGQSGIGLSADGSGNGTVGQEDYDTWKKNFGGSLSAAAASSVLAVPEPTSGVPAAVAFMMLYAQRTRLNNSAISTR